jgi:serine/threonine-protein kinase
MIGRTISHYEIGQKLGEGGMGVVYRARDTRLNRFVALKFLPDRFDRPDADPYRFLQEARTASALDHPNICTVHDIEKTDDGQMFIVMACYEGETLQTRLERGPLPVLEAVTIARQIGQGLGRAHERGIVHRDIKPSNVFITADGLVKILDFGVSRLLDESGITRTGAHIGTLRYMSPEQARGEPADQRSDVWALGVVLHEMQTGVRGHAGGGAAGDPDARSGAARDGATGDAARGRRHRRARASERSRRSIRRRPRDGGGARGGGSAARRRRTHFGAHDVPAAGGADSGHGHGPRARGRAGLVRLSIESRELGAQPGAA